MRHWLEYDGRLRLRDMNFLIQECNIFQKYLWSLINLSQIHAGDKLCVTMMGLLKWVLILFLSSHTSLINCLKVWLWAKATGQYYVTIMHTLYYSFPLSPPFTQNQLSQSLLCWSNVLVLINWWCWLTTIKMIDWGSSEQELIMSISWMSTDW